VKYLFDTSVLIAGVSRRHPEFHRCYPWLERLARSEIEGCVCTHSLAEYYAFLTGALRPQMSPVQAVALMQANLKCCEIVSLDVEDYQAVLESMVTMGLHGAVVYDAVIARAALKSGCDHILTLNLKDFLRLGAQVQTLVVAP